MKVRVVFTASKGKAVQVVNYQNYKRVILKHIGTAHTDIELADLILIAEQWIRDYSGQLSLFPNASSSNLLLLNQSSFIGVKYQLFYSTAYKLLSKIGLGSLPTILNDLAVIRIFEPASKLRSLELLEQFFGVNHNRKSYYKIAPQCIDLKDAVEQNVVKFAEAEYDFNYNIS